jgi:capsular exopolysaccharide synthesis family protein
MGRVDEAMKRAGGGILTPERPAEELALGSRTLDAAFEPGGAPPVDLDAQQPPLGTAENAEIGAAWHAGAPKERVVVDGMMPGCREQYRRLAAALHQGQAATGLKVVMISSAVAGEGKTLTASNVALTLSESYRQSVLLIDADLRRPALHSFFGLNATSGLGELLAGSQPSKAPTWKVTPTLSVLPAGRPSADPMAGLISPTMRRVVDQARDQFTWVVIDTPPVGLITDANLLASMVDGILFVVKADVTPYPLVRRAVEALGSDRLLGVVLNQATSYAHGYNYYQQYYGSSQPQPGRPA